MLQLLLRENSFGGHIPSPYLPPPSQDPPDFTAQDFPWLQAVLPAQPPFPPRCRELKRPVRNGSVRRSWRAITAGCGALQVVRTLGTWMSLTSETSIAGPSKDSRIFLTGSASSSPTLGPRRQKVRLKPSSGLEGPSPEGVCGPHEEELFQLQGASARPMGSTPQTCLSLPL